MASMKTNDIQKALLKKGFHHNPGKRNPDHDFYILYYNGQKTHIRTKISHGEKEIGDPLINRMAEQMKLHRTDFVEFVSCTLTYEAYLYLLKKLNTYELRYYSAEST